MHEEFMDRKDQTIRSSGRIIFASVVGGDHASPADGGFGSQEGKIARRRFFCGGRVPPLILTGVAGLVAVTQNRSCHEKGIRRCSNQQVGCRRCAVSSRGWLSSVLRLRVSSPRHRPKAVPNHLLPPPNGDPTSRRVHKSLKDTKRLFQRPRPEVCTQFGLARRTTRCWRSCRQRMLRRSILSP